jgi:pyrimidine-nucleoside phosphorylase
MSFVDVIARKRDGQTLTRDEIERTVAGATDGSVPDYQLSALLMAIVLRGMTDEETGWFTDAMVRSGERVDLSSLPGPKVGKHSTGGVGDKVSIALAPIVAACGVIVPKMSGRGLGHTGGTLDKLESIPGYRTSLSVHEFLAVLRVVGTSIIGQSAALAPADKRLYALRDVTATVESIPLIAASIMSKKLAEGSSTLVLDVKCGGGAFMKDESAARALAATMVAIGARAGVPTRAVITRMDAPLGRAVGNAVEVSECIALLRGEGPEELRGLILDLAAEMVALARGKDAAATRPDVERALASGEALTRFHRMVECHGGDPRVTDDPSRLPQARHRSSVVAARSGYVGALAAESIGRSAVALGAGRERAGDPVDHAAGVLIAAPPGTRVSAGDRVLELLYNDESRLAQARTLAEQAVRIDDQPPAALPLLIGHIR